MALILLLLALLNLICSLMCVGVFFYGFLWVFGVKPNRGPKGGLGCLRFLGSLYKSWRLVRVGAKVVADKVKEMCALKFGWRILGLFGHCW